MELWPADGSVSFKQMLESGIDDGNNYINLNRSSNEDLETFHAAVKKLWQIASDTGPAFLHDPDAYEPYMRWLAELEEMSRRSVKKPKNEKGTGSINEIR